MPTNKDGFGPPFLLHLTIASRRFHRPMLRFTDGAVYAEGSASRHTTTDKPLKNNPEHSMLGIVSYEVSSMECFRFCRAAWGLWGTGARPALVSNQPEMAV